MNQAHRKYKIHGVVFDWNGTLSNDIPKIYQVTMRVVRKTGGVPTASFQEYRRLIRNPYILLYRDLGCTAPLSKIRYWYHYYINRTKVPVDLFPDAISLLKFLKRKGIKIGVVSSHPTKLIEKEMKKYDIDKLIDFVRGDLHTKGRHIELFLKTYDLKPGEVLYVGDMVNDIVEAKSCGVISAAYLKGVDTADKLLPNRPDIVLKNLASLKKFIAIESASPRQ